MALLNIEKVLSQLQRWGEGFFDGVVEEQVKVAKEVMILARDTYCPIDTGDLRSTATVNAEVRELHLASADIQFGGPAAEYAAIVHEDLEATHAPPTQAKYLERAARELSNEITVRVGFGAVAAARRRASI